LPPDSPNLDPWLEALQTRGVLGAHLPIPIARRILERFTVQAGTVTAAPIEEMLIAKAEEYVGLLRRLSRIPEHDAETATFRKAIVEAMEKGDFAAAEAHLTLAEIAQEIATLFQTYTAQLTAAAGQLADAPDDALPRIDLALASAAIVESRQIAFLDRMGEFGRKQAPVAKAYWVEQRRQLRVMQSQGFVLVRNWPRALEAIAAARASTGADPLPDDERELLDELEEICRSV
jgi:hypothetical protein